MLLKSRGLLVLSVVLAIVVFAALSWQRDKAYGGPHHDEVIALLAAKGLERSYARLNAAEAAPFNQIVEASEWHKFTHGFEPVNFSEIREDVFSRDKHPPLAFWLMNRWLSLFTDGGYEQAVFFVWLQILAAGGLLSLATYRLSGKPTTAALAFVLFLAGNSAIFTSIWVRQYALFVVCFTGVLVATLELVRRDLAFRTFIAFSSLIACFSLLGMMTQYTFATMSAPLHLALLSVLIYRKQWRQVSVLVGAYVIAGGLFLIALPGVFDHVSIVSAGLKRDWQIQSALWAIPQMYIPVPSSMPGWLRQIGGTAGLVGPIILVLVLFRMSSTWSDTRNKAGLLLILSGMLGAGLLQFLFVAFGLFPSWATGENHMISFWVLTVLAVSLLFDEVRWRNKNYILMLVLSFMVGVQVLYIWNLKRIFPMLNKSYIASQNPDLVILDNLARGFTLEISDMVPGAKMVLAARSEELANRFINGDLENYSKILYLPMQNTVLNCKEFVVAAAKTVNRKVKVLPVTHPGMYEAIILEN